MIESAEEFVRLRTSDDPELYGRAAHEPASEEVWLEVIERYPDMKQWVIHNKTVPLSILELLIDDPDPKVRAHVAEKRKLTPEMFQKLVRDVDNGVRHRLVFNAKTPAAVLDLLAHDSSAQVADDARERIGREH